MFGTGVSASTVVKRGVAIASECGFQGPFGPGSLGWWWTCEASIEWEDGTIERQRFLQSQLTSSDLDKPVDVELRRVLLSQGKGSFEEYFRADFVPNIFLGNLISVPLMAVGCLILFWFLTRIVRWIMRTRRTNTGDAG